MLVRSCGNAQITGPASPGNPRRYLDSGRPPVPGITARRTNRGDPGDGPRPGLYSWVTVRVPSIRRRLVPAVAGGALLVVGLGAAVTVLSGGQAAAGRAAAVAGPGLASTASASTVPASAVSVGGGPAGKGSPGAGLAGQASTHLVVPDVIASVPGGVTPADLARVKRLAGVRAVLAIDGARITVNGVQLTVLAAPAAALRPWTPPATAASQ